MNTGMGPVSLTEQEVWAWQQNTGIELSAWESRFIRGLSREYLAANHEFEDAEVPVPWQAIESVDRPVVAKRIKNVLRGL